MRPIEVLQAPAQTMGRAPVVTVPLGQAVAPQLNNLPANTRWRVGVRIKGQWIPLGSVRVSRAGEVTLPAFALTTPGNFLLRMTGAKSPRFLRIQATTN